MSLIDNTEIRCRVADIVGLVDLSTDARAVLILSLMDGAKQDRSRQGRTDNKMPKPRRRDIMVRLLTVSGVARMLHVHINTVRRWSNRGDLVAYRIGPRGDRRFRTEDINRLIQKANNRK